MLACHLAGTGLSRQLLRPIASINYRAIFGIKGDIYGCSRANRIPHIRTDNDGIVYPGKRSIPAGRKTADAMDDFKVKATF